VKCVCGYEGDGFEYLMTFSYDSIVRGDLPEDENDRYVYFCPKRGTLKVEVKE